MAVKDWYAAHISFEISLSTGITVQDFAKFYMCRDSKQDNVKEPPELTIKSKMDICKDCPILKRVNL